VPLVDLPFPAIFFLILRIKIHLQIKNTEKIYAQIAWCADFDEAAHWILDEDDFSNSVANEKIPGGFMAISFFFMF
jgi:hypothetical protein